MQKTTRWRPDTCSCDIEYTWDTDEPQSSRTLTVSKVNNRCTAHAALNLADTYVTVIDENKRKNLVRGSFLTEYPAIFGKEQEDGSFDFKRGITINWSWSGSGDSRVLTILVVGYTLTTLQRTRLQQKADARFGVGKVIIG